MQTNAKKKIAFISTDWNDNKYRKNKVKYGGVSYYRLVKPMEALREKYDVKFLGADIQKDYEGLSTDGFYDALTSDYHMIIVKQIDNATACQALDYWCKKNNCILVQDYDDDMLAVREDQPSHKMGYRKGGTLRAYAAAMMSIVDALIVSNDKLKDSFSGYLKKIFEVEKDIFVYPNYNDIQDWEYIQPSHNPKKVVIGWAGSITHDADLKMVMPVIGKLLNKHDHVYAEFLGGIMQGKIAYLTEGWTKKAKDKFKVIMGTPAWDAYPKLMRSQAWDIGIAPLIDDEFNKSKSHIKWMEYAMCGIPTIASRVYPYFMPINGKRTIEHGVTGYLAQSEKEWEKYLELLIADPDERKRIAGNAYTYVGENLQWNQNEDAYVEIVSSIFSKFANK